MSIIAFAVHKFFRFGEVNPMNNGLHFSTFWNQTFSVALHSDIDIPDTVSELQDAVYCVIPRALRRSTIKVNGRKSELTDSLGLRFKIL